jgi:toxin ParE1/3/4
MGRPGSAQGWVLETNIPTAPDRFRHWHSVMQRTGQEVRIFAYPQPGHGLAVRDTILRSLQDLALFPGIGRRQNVEGVRKLVTRRYPYLVYYTIDEGAEEAVILTIQHSSRSLEYSDV